MTVNNDEQRETLINKGFCVFLLKTEKVLISLCQK
nr:MAG TPA: hypothetical protein [Caudoviricetes sp.]